MTKKRGKYCIPLIQLIFQGFSTLMTVPVLFTELFRPPSQHLLSHLSASLTLVLPLSLSSCVCCRWSAGSDPSLPWLHPTPGLELSLQQSQGGPWPQGRHGGLHQRAGSLCVLTGEVSTAGCGFTATRRWIPMGKNNSYMACNATNKWLWQTSVLQVENGNMLLLWNSAISEAHCSFGLLHALQR